MGFWDVTKRMIQGKPAFETPPNANDPWEDEAPTDAYAEERRAQKTEVSQSDPKSLYDAHGYKHPPIVSIISTNTQGSGDHVEIWSTIKNESDREVFLDKITLLGTVFQLNYPLSPADQHMFRVFTGKQFDHDNYTRAELYFKDVPTGDYFRADHTIQYKYDSDGTYEVNDLELVMPIKDV